jgi:hypothetical protein
MSLSSHQRNGGHGEWLTPPELLALLGPFDLDPCAPVVRPWDTADRHFTVEDNGLKQTWEGRVWLNPPFGREAAAWMRKMATHKRGIALLPARTETVMFYESVWPCASAICFIRGRPHFHYVDGRRAKANSGAPICLIAYSTTDAVVLKHAGLGAVVTLDHQEIT